MIRGKRKHDFRRRLVVDHQFQRGRGMVIMITFRRDDWLHKLTLGLVAWAATLLASDLAYSNQNNTQQNWPMLRHDLARSGRVETALYPPYEIAWVRDFNGEMILTRSEPIVAAGKVFVGTYQGGLYCLDIHTGEQAWMLRLPGPILHAPSWSEDRLFVPGTFGICAVDASSGRRLWCFAAGRGGFATSPAVVNDLVLAGARDGNFVALDVHSGQRRWNIPVGAPIRLTAAVANDVAFFAAEDMRVYAVNITEGKIRWRSEKLWGQSFRDYAPLVVSGKVIVRSSPVLHFATHVASDTAFLARQAGLPDNHWQTIDAFLRSEKIWATPDQIQAEQAAIRQRLRKEPWLKTFYVLEADSGREEIVAPVLYTGGCAGVGNPPALGPDGRVVVIYRSAYGNFSLGVAPFVSVGLLDVSTGNIEPIFHQHGKQPPWNTFWGTADEAQSLTTAENLIYFCHQGTLSVLDLSTRRLAPVAGKRDSWGGFTNVPGILNEWHGPARGSAVVVDDLILWITGSRLIAVRGQRR